MQRRVIGILAHVDAGKTTITERLLHLGGAVQRPGAVERGNTVTDWLEDEQERGITISTAAATFSWRGVAIDIVDTPGHVDFSVEVDRCLRVLDGAILVLSAPDGVQAQTEALWRALRQAGVPTVVVVNKLDSPHAELDDLLDRAASRLDATLLPVQWPVFEDTEDAFVWYGHWDLPGGVWVEIDEEGDGEGEEADAVILSPEIAIRREALVESLAEHDDGIMAAYLDGVVPSSEQLVAAIREATHTLRVLPVVFGVAYDGTGMEALVDAAIAYLPSPAQSRERLVYTVDGEASTSDTGAQAPFMGYVFKTETRADAVIVYVRVFAGELRSDEPLFVVGREEPLVGVKLVELLGRETIEVSVLRSGAVGALLMPRSAIDVPTTGDTLCGSQSALAFERPPLWLPVVWAAIEAQEAADHTRLGELIHAHGRDDPSLAITTDPTTGQYLIGGRGELHLEVLHRRLERQIGVEGRVRLGALIVRRQRHLAEPQAGSGSALSAEGSEWVEIKVTIAPGRAPSGGPILRGFPLKIGEVRLEAMRSAIGHVFTEVSDGSCDVEWPIVTIEAIRLPQIAELSPIVYREAVVRGLREAVDLAQWHTFEPIARYDATVPHENVGRFHAELQRRGVDVPGPVDSFGAYQVFLGEAPLAPLLGFARVLRILTNGRGHWAIRPAGLGRVPDLETNVDTR